MLSEGDEIGAAQFPQIAAQVAGCGGAALPTAGGDMPLVPESKPVLPALLASPPTVLPVPGTMTLIDAQGEVRPLEEIEAEAIRYAISHYRNQMSQVARRLRIGRSTLYRKLESLGLAPDTSAEKAEVAAE